MVIPTTVYQSEVISDHWIQGWAAKEAADGTELEWMRSAIPTVGSCERTRVASPTKLGVKGL